MINNETMAFQLISVSGTAKSFALESIRENKKGNIEQAHKLLDEAKEQIQKAHKIQEELIKNGANEPVDLLMVHAQDHLMSSMMIIDLVYEIIT